MDRQRGAGLVCCDTHGTSAKRGALKKAEIVGPGGVAPHDVGVTERAAPPHDDHVIGVAARDAGMPNGHSPHFRKIREEEHREELCALRGRYFHPESRGKLNRELSERWRAPIGRPSM